jgi:ABC-2 type transport system ATP-binding protein
VQVFGQSPLHDAADVLPRVGFLAQDRPLYKGFSVEESLRLGRKLNARWDDAFARSRMERLGLPLDRKVGRLSGGQQAQVSLVMALAKRPDLLLLDEPVAALDPLARREFLQMVVEVVADTGMGVVLSSHIIGDLERVCDSIIILSHAQVQLGGEIEDVVARHKLLVGPRTSADSVAHIHNVVQATHSERQTSLLVRINGHVWDPSWQINDVTLEEIVLAYLGQTSSSYIEALQEVPA